MANERRRSARIQQREENRNDSTEEDPIPEQQTSKRKREVSPVFDSSSEEYNDTRDNQTVEDSSVSEDESPHEQDLNINSGDNQPPVELPVELDRHVQFTLTQDGELQLFPRMKRTKEGSKMPWVEYFDCPAEGCPSGRRREQFSELQKHCWIKHRLKVMTERKKRVGTCKSKGAIAARKVYTS